MSPGMFSGSPYEPNPDFAPKQTKTGYLFYEVWSELMPGRGESLYGRLLFEGSKHSDARGQSETIDLLGLFVGSPPSGPIHCN